MPRRVEVRHFSAWCTAGSASALRFERAHAALDLMCFCAMRATCCMRNVTDLCICLCLYECAWRLCMRAYVNRLRVCVARVRGGKVQDWVWAWAWTWACACTGVVWFQAVRFPMLTYAYSCHLRLTAFVEYLHLGGVSTILAERQGWLRASEAEKWPW